MALAGTAGFPCGNTGHKYNLGDELKSHSIFKYTAKQF